jgi:hypothetical protein
MTFHCDWLRQSTAYDSTRRNVNRSPDQAPRGETPAGVTSTRLFDRRRRCHLLLLACEIRYQVPALCGAIVAVRLGHRLFVFMAKRRVRLGRMLPQVVVGRNEGGVHPLVTQ